MKIKWGVIGCGGIAYRRTIPGMMLSENSELFAVMDADFNAACKVKDEFGAKYAVMTVEELLAIKELDAVYIATPVFCHKEQVKKSADAGKHILLEKPMCLTAEQSQEVKDYCAARGVKLGVGFMMRYSVYHEKMREMIKNGELGELVSLRAQFTCWYPEIENAWRQDKKLSGGGALMDMGIHCIDILQYVSGMKAKSLYCMADNLSFGYNVEDSAVLLMKMENGAMASVEAFFNIPDNAAKCRLEFYGTKGSILAEGTLGQTDGGFMEVSIEGADKGYSAQQNRASSGFTAVELSGGNLYEKEISAFADAIITDTEPKIGAEDGIFVQRLVELAYKSAKEGRSVTV